MCQPVLESLPSLAIVERDLSRIAREARLLRSLRAILKRKQSCERAARLLRNERKPPRT